MPLSDSDFARVLNHLYLMSARERFDDKSLAEALIRAGVVLLSIHGGPDDGEAAAATLLKQSLTWCRRMTPNIRPHDDRGTQARVDPSYPQPRG